MLKLPEVQQFKTAGNGRVYSIPARVMSDLTGRAYLILGGETPTLIDTGGTVEDSLRDIFDGLNSVRTEFGESFTLPDIRRILITHAHIDHIGGLPELLRLTKAEVGIHPLDRPRLTHPEEEVALAQFRTARFLVEAGVEPEHARTLLREHVLPRLSRTRVDVSLDLNDGDTDRRNRMPPHPRATLRATSASPSEICSSPATTSSAEPSPNSGLKPCVPSWESATTTPRSAASQTGRTSAAAWADTNSRFPDLPHRIEQILAAQNRRTERVADAIRERPPPP